MVLFGDTILFDLVVVVGTLCVALYTYVTWSRNKWMRKGIPVSDQASFLGNMTDLILRRKSNHELFRDFYLKNKGKPYVTFYAFTQPLVMINDLDLVKNILIKDFHVFTDRHTQVSPNEPIFYWSLITSKGEFWKALRQRLSPTFTSGKLKRMFELVDACGKEFLSHLEREMDENGDVVMKEATARYTSDIVTTTAFGVEGDAMRNKDSAFRKFMRMNTEPTPAQGFKFLIAMLFPSLFQMLDLKLVRPEVKEFVRKTVWSTVEYREKNNVKRNDFLDLLMQLRSKGYVEDDEDSPKNDQNANDFSQQVKIEFDGDVFAAQCLLFMIAGFDTSATTMTWALYELAQQPDLQQKAYEEIVRVLEEHGGKVSYDAIQEMEFLQRVIQETLRKYPVLSILDREALQPYKIPGTSIVLEKGQGVMISVSGIHHDPDFYPEPDKFDPERFTQENIQRRPPCSFLGFGDGPRMCIGMRMALLQTKVGISYILKNFSIKTCERTPIPVVFDKSNMVPSSDRDIFLRLEKRAQ